jgi:cytochrome c oxidase assembly factor CtaG
MKKIKETTAKFQKEVRKNMGTAVLAAFAFTIALVWRDAIQESVSKIVNLLGLTESIYFYKIIVAIIVTVVCVIGLMFFSKWVEKDTK